MSLERDIDFLRNLPLLSELSPDQLRLLAFGADFRITREGETLFELGDQAESGYLVKTGSIGLFSDPDQSEPDEIAGPGTLIGELALIIDTTRPVRAVALERTELLQIRRALFRRMLEEFPAIAKRLQHALAERVGGFARQLTPVASHLEKIDDEDRAFRKTRLAEREK